MPASPIPFGGRAIGAGHAVVVIAEIGINHEGDPAACARLIEEAAGSGADAIKLQTMDADENYVRGTESHALFSRAALGREQTAAMFALARRLGMEAFTTAGDSATIEWVARLKPAAHKISSGLMTNHRAIRTAAATGLPLLVSTGMALPAEIDEAVAAARRGGCQALGLFQCTSLYPAPPETLDLAAIGWLEARYAAPAGFSDHSRGIEAAPLAVAAGARMLEKHFTLDPARPGFDHALSLSPAVFAAMVAAVRRAEVMMGKSTKQPGSIERAKSALYHRIVVARCDVRLGDILDTENVGLKRPLPGTRGLHPVRYEEVIGRHAARAFARDEAIGPNDVTPPLNP